MADPRRAMVIRISDMFSKSIDKILESLDVKITAREHEVAFDRETLRLEGPGLPEKAVWPSEGGCFAKGELKKNSGSDWQFAMTRPPL